MRNLLMIAFCVMGELVLLLSDAPMAYALSMTTCNNNNNNLQSSSRRTFLSKTVVVGTTAMVTTTTSWLQQPSPAQAAPEIFTTANGIKYAILKPAIEKTKPFDKDIVAIEYTGYLTDGSIFDSTHAEGKKNALAFSVGSANVIEGFSEMVKYMGIGEKVQAIIPPKLAFGDRGICLAEKGECLVKPNSTLVFDITLKRVAVPPP